MRWGFTAGRLATFGATLIVGAWATGAAAQSYDYLARFQSPVRTGGAVVASGISWTCAGQDCRTSGPWPAPGVGACAALAGIEGQIVEYGHPKAQLGPADLKTCNAGVQPVKELARPRLNDNPAFRSLAFTLAPAATGPRTVQTSPLIASGTGYVPVDTAALAAARTAATAHVTTAPLIASGTGWVDPSSLPPPPPPVKVTTAPLIATGTRTP